VIPKTDFMKKVLPFSAAVLLTLSIAFLQTSTSENKLQAFGGPYLGQKCYLDLETGTNCHWDNPGDLCGEVINHHGTLKCVKY